MKQIFIYLLLMVITATVFGQNVYVVTKTTDPNPFTDKFNNDDNLCDPDMYGTLQWAINKVNYNGGESRIEFNIPGTGVHEISSNSYFPQIKNPVVIDGTTQAGYTTGSPVVKITGQMKTQYGFNVYNTTVTIKGLEISNFARSAIMLNECSNSKIIDNKIYNISFSGGYGLHILACNYTEIYGNRIEIDALPEYGRSSVGIYIDKCSYCTIGGTETGKANIIANCQKVGVVINSDKYNKVSGNSIYNNPKAIQLGTNANDNIQPPVINSYTNGILSGTALPNSTIEIFGSTGAENANEYLVSVVADEHGDWSVEINIQHEYEFLLATVTNENNSTSRFCSAKRIPKPSSLLAVFCDNHNISKSDTITAYEIPIVDKYEFQFENLGTGELNHYISSNNSLDLSLVSGLIEGATYSVKVRTIISLESGLYGEPCLITMSNSPMFHTNISDLIIEFGEYQDHFQSDIYEDNNIKVFDKISLKGCSYNEDLGMPQIPVFYKRYVVSADLEVSDISIQYGNKNEIEGEYYLNPVQEPVPLDGYGITDYVYPNIKVYSSDNPYPGINAQIISNEMEMGFRIITVRYSPVEYHPLSKKIFYYDNINISFIQSKSSDLDLPEQMSYYRYNITKDYIQKTVENPEVLNSVKGGAKNVNSSKLTTKKLSLAKMPDENGDVPDYIIITDELFVDEFNELAEWKTLKGVPTVVISVQDIYDNYLGNNNIARIQNYINYIYNNWGSMFILFGGDYDFVPATITTGKYATDYYYNKGIFGRAPVRTESDVSSFVSKLISYESLNNVTDYSGLTNHLFLCGFLDYNEESCAIINDSYADYLKTELAALMIPGDPNSTFIPPSKTMKLLVENSDCSLDNYNYNRYGFCNPNEQMYFEDFNSASVMNLPINWTQEGSGWQVINQNDLLPVAQCNYINKCLMFNSTTPCIISTPFFFVQDLFHFDSDDSYDNDPESVSLYYYSSGTIYTSLDNISIYYRVVGGTWTLLKTASLNSADGWNTLKFSTTTIPIPQQGQLEIQIGILTNSNEPVYIDNLTVGESPYELGEDCNCIPNGNGELNKVNSLLELNNSNYQFVYQSDHGNPYSIGVGSHGKLEHLSRTDMDELTNNFPQIFITGACKPAQFQKDCFAEHYFNNPNSGGVAFIGNSGNGYYTELGVMPKNFFKALYYNNVYTLGFTFLSTSYSTNDRIQLFGDPEMPIWSGIPNNLLVSYTPTIVSNQDNHLTVTVDGLFEDALITVCIYKSEEIYGYLTKECTTGTPMSFEFDVSPETLGTIKLTVTSHNYIPYITDIPVEITGKHLFISNYSIDDSDSNSNEIIESGENIIMPISISNSGNEDALSTVSGTIRAFKKESFETVFMGSTYISLPDFWSIPLNIGNWDIGYSSEFPSDYIPDGNKCIFHEATSDSYLSTKEIELQPNSILKFNMYHSTIVSNDKVTIKYQEVGTGIWITLSEYMLTDLIDEWKEHIVDLSSCPSSNLYLALWIEGDGQKIYIDNIKISSPYVAINENYSEFGGTLGITAGNDAISSSDYQFNIINNTPNNESLLFELQLEDGENNNYVDEIMLEIKSPDLIIYPSICYSYIGDIIYFNIDLYNQGGASAEGVHAILESDTDFTNTIEYFVSSNSSYNLIENNETVTCNNEFGLKPMSGFSLTDIHLRLIVIDDKGNTWIKKFVLDDSNSESAPNISEFSSGVTSISLKWSGNSIAHGYNLFRMNPQECVNCDVDDILNYEGPINNILIPNTTSITYVDYNCDLTSVYYYRLSLVDNNNNETCISDYKMAWTSLEVANGWPVTFTGPNYCVQSSEGGIYGSPKAVDIDFDNDKEIFLTLRHNDTDFTTSENGGYVVALHHDGDEYFPMLDGNTTTVSGFAYMSARIETTPAIGDIDNNGDYEVIVGTRNSGINKRKVFAYSTDIVDNTGLPMAPQIKWESPAHQPHYRGCMLNDINNNSKLETISFTEWGGVVGEVFESLSGNSISGWPRNITGSYGMGATGDIDNNGNIELLYGTPNGLYIFNEDGTDWATNPYPFVETYNLGSSPVLVDLDGNGTLEIIMIGGSGTTGYLLVKEVFGNTMHDFSGWTNHLIHSINLSSDSFIPNPSVGDLNGDGDIEIVHLANNKLIVWNSDGTLLFESIISGLNGQKIPPILADIDNDPEIEIIIGALNTFNIHGYNNDGSKVIGFPLVVQSDLLAAPLVNDVDGDGMNEIIAGAGNEIYVWNTNGDANKIEWGSERHDSWNTGCYHTLTAMVYRGKRCGGISDGTAKVFVEDGTPPFDYEWSTGQNFFAVEEYTSEINGLSLGDYSVTITDSKNRTRVIDFEVNSSTDMSFVDYSVTGSEEFNSATMYLDDRITIPNGTTLTLNDSYLFANNESLIKVERGGQLILNNTSIATCDDQMWSGIRVFGDKNMYGNIPYASPGKLEIKNNSEIHNASIGVWAADNAVAKITDSKFYNCHVGVWLMSYDETLVNSSNNPTLKPRAYINRSEFITDDNYLTNPWTHVYLLGVDKVLLKRNKYLNTTAPDVLIGANRGKGLYSVNSGFSVIENRHILGIPDLPSTPDDKSIFEGLYYGIFAQNTTGNTAVIRNCEFRNYEYIGAYLRGVTAPTITSNTYHKDEHVYIAENAGLYLEGCNAYKIENNTFLRGSIGLVIRTSSTFNNTVYRNHFQSSRQAIHSYDVNSNSDGSEGLFIQCNDFHDNTVQNYIRSGNIKLEQGFNHPYNDLLDISAANQFDQDHLTYPNAFRTDPNNETSFNYKYWYNRPNDVTDINGFTSDNVDAFPTGILFNLSETCPSDLPGLHLEDILSVDGVYNIIIEISSLNSSLNNLIDGGNTQVVLQNVQALKPNNFNKTCNDLLEMSPYLSDTVLLTFMRTNVNGHTVAKTNVLLANSPLPENALMELEVMNLPAPHKTLIRQNQDGTNAVVQKKSEISQLTFEKDQIIGSYLRFGLQNDSLMIRKDSIVDFLINDDNFESKCLVIPILVSDKQYNDAQSQIHELEYLATNEKPALQAELSEFAALQEVVMKADTAYSEGSLTLLVNNNLSLIEALANNPSHRGCAQAQTLLSIAGITEFEPELFFPVDNRNLRFSTQELQISENIDMNDLLEIYPNPASKEVWIEYLIFDDNNGSKIEIFDIEGRLVMTQAIRNGYGIEEIDVSSLSEGSYILKIGKYSKKLDVMK
ncbi:MAG: C25 family cysteine peptidase [Bacteroidales bacterium]|nr:C25 family cysteine peptidase [Bacteroidales bacterium]